MDKSGKLIICDICDTLFDSNTTFDFLEYAFAKEGGFRFFAVRFIKSKWSPLHYFLGFLSRVLKKDFARILGLSLLKGRSYYVVLLAAQDFYHHFLEFRANRVIFDILASENEKGRVILVSSSIDPVVKTIASQNKMIAVSSELEVNDGLFTGRLQKDLSGQKHEVVKKMIEEYRTEKLLVITDNRSDLELVEMADERFVVIKSEKEKKFWQHLSPLFIKL